MFFESPLTSRGISLFGSSEDTLGILTHLFEENPKVISRPVGAMIISKAGKVVVKIFEQDIIHQFYGESDFTVFVEKNRQELDCTLPLIGSMLFKRDEFLELVGHNRAPQTHRDLLKILSVNQSDAPDDGGGEDFVKDIFPNNQRLVGVIVMEYLPESFNLTEFIVQRRHIQEEFYFAELCYIFAKVLAFVVNMQRISPSAKHHDLKPDNIIIRWLPKAPKIPVRSWPKEVLYVERLPEGEGEGEDIKPRVCTVLKPPDFTVKVIDFGLGWRPEGYSRHLADKTIAMYGVAPTHNPYYDIHTFANGLVDTILHRPEISEKGLYKCERVLMGAIASVFGDHMLGFGMVVNTNFMVSGRGAARGGFPLHLGPQPLVQTRISALPRTLNIYPGEQEAQVQAAFVILLQRSEVDGLKKMVASRCAPEIIDDLLSDEPERILSAASFFNLNCINLPPPQTMLLDNLFRLKGVVTSH